MEFKPKVNITLSNFTSPTCCRFNADFDLCRSLYPFACLSFEIGLSGLCLSFHVVIVFFRCRHLTANTLIIHRATAADVNIKNNYSKIKFLIIHLFLNILNILKYYFIKFSYLRDFYS